MTTLPIFEPKIFSALLMFAFASSITPGPNNTMLMASGANFGIRRTIPHWLGILVGFAALMFACGLGVGGLFTAYPVLHEVLKWAGAAYMVYLAAKIGFSGSLSAGSKAGAPPRPMSFWAAAAFQLVNVKAWAMGLGAVTTYIPAQHYFANLVVATLVFVANFWCGFVWMSCGLVLRRYLERPLVLRTFNIVMALLLLASLYPLFI